MIELFGLGLGLVGGSFLNVVVLRVNRGENFIKGRSKCPRCGKKIAWFDNLPLLSFVLLGGKCRSCHKPISFQYPIVEATSGLVWFLSWLAYKGGTLPFSGDLGILAFPVWVAILTLMLGLMVSDFVYMTLPDVFMYPLGIVSLGLVGYVFRGDWGEIGVRVLTGLVVALFFFLIWYLTKGRGMGFGDVEYALVMGLLLGFPAVLVGLMFSFVVGAVVGLGMVGVMKKGWKSKLAFGPFLIGGNILALYWGERILEWYMGYLI